MHVRIKSVPTVKLFQAMIRSVRTKKSAKLVSLPVGAVMVAIEDASPSASPAVMVRKQNARKSLFFFTSPYARFRKKS